ncbi:flagellar biosynthesis protein FlhF [Nitrospira sp. BLG_1]|uniref:flagellar biosynthesis protein FlhF n=1 Tax=Nitrospira sp. BLG_1 TaxID=3395883 RepID=UPI0039BD1850
MKVKTFHALTMQDALRAIKEELGPDAIILSSKEVREGGRLLRVFNHTVLEVMAAAEYERPQVVRESTPVQESVPPVRTSGGGPSALHPVNTFQQTLRGMLEPTNERKPRKQSQQEPSSKSATSTKTPNRRRQVRAVYDELSQLLRELSPDACTPRAGQSSSVLSTLRQSLCDQGMHPSTTELLLGEVLKTDRLAHVSDEQMMRRALYQEVVRRVRVTGPLDHGQARPAIELFIGPSGAGKTSAVAKLAAFYRLEQQKSVALITFDSYRETAVEQLRRYAKIIGVPFACALSARQVQAGLRRHAKVDLVLMDMPGIAPADLALAQDLCRLLKHDAITTHLVLPAAIRAQEACRMTGCVRALPDLRLFFTKLDETDSSGTIFEVGHATGLPLSYWSIGRRVPGDIEVASPEVLAGRLTAGSTERAHDHVGQSDRSAGAKVALAATGTYHR